MVSMKQGNSGHRLSKSNINAKANVDLMEACIKGNIRVARDAINAGANLDTRFEQDWTPLHRAAQFGHLEIVKELVSRKASIEPQTKAKWTPLHAAAFAGHREIVDLLIQRKADVDCKDDAGWTPLVAAASNGHLLVTQTLLAQGANVYTLTQANTSALILAMNHGYDSVADVLLAAEDSRSPEREERVKLLKERELAVARAVLAEENSGITQLSVLSVQEQQHLDEKLWQAARNGHLEGVRVALEAGANTHYKGAHAMDAIEAARCSGNRRCHAFMEAYGLLRAKPVEQWGPAEVEKFVEGNLPLHVPSGPLKAQMRIHGPFTGNLMRSAYAHHLFWHVMQLTPVQRSALCRAATCLRHGFQLVQHLDESVGHFARQFENLRMQSDLTDRAEVRKFLGYVEARVTPATHIVASPLPRHMPLLPLLLKDASPDAHLDPNLVPNVGRARATHIADRLRWWSALEWEVKECADPLCQRCKGPAKSGTFGLERVFGLQLGYPSSPPPAAKGHADALSPSESEDIPGSTAEDVSASTCSPTGSLSLSQSQGGADALGLQVVSPSGTGAAANTSSTLMSLSFASSVGTTSASHASGSSQSLYPSPPGSPALTETLGITPAPPTGAVAPLMPNMHVAPAPDAVPPLAHPTPLRSAHAYAHMFPHCISHKHKHHSHAHKEPSCGIRLRHPDQKRTYRLHLLCDGLWVLPPLATASRLAIRPCDHMHPGLVLKLTDTQLLRIAPYLCYALWVMSLCVRANGSRLLSLLGTTIHREEIPAPTASTHSPSAAASPANAATVTPASPAASSGTPGAMPQGPTSDPATSPAAAISTSLMPPTPLTVQPSSPCTTLVTRVLSPTSPENRRRNRRYRWQRNCLGESVDTPELRMRVQQVLSGPICTPSFIPPIPPEVRAVRSSFFGPHVFEQLQPVPIAKPFTPENAPRLRILPIVPPPTLSKPVDMFEQQQQAPPAGKSSAWMALQKRMREKQFSTLAKKQEVMREIDVGSEAGDPASSADEEVKEVKEEVRVEADKVEDKVEEKETCEAVTQTPHIAVVPPTPLSVAVCAVETTSPSASPSSAAIIPPTPAAKTAASAPVHAAWCDGDAHTDDGSDVKPSLSTSVDTCASDTSSPTSVPPAMALTLAPLVLPTSTPDLLPSPSTANPHALSLAVDDTHMHTPSPHPPSTPSSPSARLHLLPPDPSLSTDEQQAIRDTQQRLAALPDRQVHVLQSVLTAFTTRSPRVPRARTHSQSLSPPPSPVSSAPSSSAAFTPSHGVFAHAHAPSVVFSHPTPTFSRAGEFADDMHVQVPARPEPHPRTVHPLSRSAASSPISTSSSPATSPASSAASTRAPPTTAAPAVAAAGAAASAGGVMVRGRAHSMVDGDEVPVRRLAPRVYPSPRNNQAATATASMDKKSATSSALPMAVGDAVSPSAALLSAPLETVEEAVDPEECLLGPSWLRTAELLCHNNSIELLREVHRHREGRPPRETTVGTAPAAADDVLVMWEDELEQALLSCGIYAPGTDVKDLESMVALFGAYSTHSADHNPSPTHEELPLLSATCARAATTQSLHTVTSEARAALLEQVEVQGDGKWRPPKQSTGLVRVKDVEEHRDLWMCARHGKLAEALDERFRVVGEKGDPLDLEKHFHTHNKCVIM